VRTRAVGPATLLLGLVLGLVLGGCSFFTDEDLATEPVPGAAPGAGAPPPLLRYYEQDVSWRECRDDLECAEIEVPLDYAEPEGDVISLSMLRAPAEDPGRRIGSLVVNPGGPGVSAVDYAARSGSAFGEELREVFDIVGVDPRGVAASTPVECRTDAELDAYVAGDPSPDSRAELRAARELFRDFGEGCLDDSGDLARHISTEESARDLDIVRAVLGQEQLTYFGASYGTLLGATYADLFPERAGRLVLDGAIDPTVGAVEQAEVQAGGFETALRAYVEDCVDDGDCYLGDDVEGGLERIRGLLDDLDSQPLPGDGDRELTEGSAVYGIWAPLYDETYWGLLDEGLEAALDGDGRALLVLSDAYVSRGPEGYLNNSIEALVAINCLDRSGGLTPAQARRQEDRLVEASPTFGRIFAVGLTGCRDWPVQTGNEPAELTASGSDPILVIGTSRDPATPLVWAEALAEQLEAGVLVRRDGDGHTGYGVGNDCVDDTVEAYLVSGEVPDATVDC
jgi:pimeloyl-ACP methyl ester carboxylesterase